MEKTIIKIRPHHGMCMHFYVGKGYSDAFNMNMTNYKHLLDDSNPMIQIVDGVDGICAACPNNVAGKCSSEEKAGTYDSKVLLHTGLKSGDIMLWLDFCKKIEKDILSCGIREKICGNCEWTELCK